MKIDSEKLVSYHLISYICVINERLSGSIAEVVRSPRLLCRRVRKTNEMKNRRLLLSLLLLVVSLPVVHARSVTDSVRVYYRRGYSVLDRSFAGNGEALDRFIARLDSLTGGNPERILSFTFEGKASPDGSHVANQRLTEKRGARMVEWLRTRIDLPDSAVHIVAEGVDWEGLAELVERTPEVPEREAVLEIVRHTPLWIFDDEGRVVSGRKKRLMDLAGGRPYKYMYEHLFPELRNTSVVLRCEVLVADPVATRMPVRRSLAEAAVPPAPQRLAPREVPSRAGSGAGPREPLHRLALKTNLVYDAVLMPSLEVEYRIDDRWSVNVEGEVAWWKRDSRHKYYQIATLGPEARYWFKTKKPWHGHYVGLFGLGSWYDLENGGRGYKGEFWSVGLSYGYMFPVSRSLSFEAGIGVGFLRTWYEEYLPIDGHYVYQQSSRTNYFGPVKLKFAFVWRLWDQNRKGGAR